MTVALNGLKGLDLDQVAFKTLEVLRLGELAVEAGGTGFEQVLGTGDQVFDIELDAEVAAEGGAVLVSDAGELVQIEIAIATQSAFTESFGQFFVFGSGGELGFQRGASFGVLLNQDAQGPLAACGGEFHVHHVQAKR